MALEFCPSQNRELAVLAAVVIVQANDTEHLPGLFVDGDEGHRHRRVIMNELVDQFGRDFAHGGEEAQPQILRRDVAEEIRIERGVRDFERTDQDLFAGPQSDVALKHRVRPALAQGSRGTAMPSMRHQDRHGHGLENAAGDAAADELAQARMAVAAHLDHVGR